MNNSEPSSFRGVPVCALAALALFAGCGGPRERSDAAPGPAQRLRPLGLEPILWARSDVAYEELRAEPLRALHADLSTLLGEPLLFRVIPYVAEDVESEESVLAGETLEIYYQESRGSVNALRRRVDRIVRRVQSAFPGLDENDHLLIHARLPEGKIVADLDPGLSGACGARNALRTDVRPSSYVPGRLEELNFALCDGPSELDARLQDPSWPLIEGNWRTDDPSP